MLFKTLSLVPIKSLPTKLQKNTQLKNRNTLISGFLYSILSVYLQFMLNRLIEKEFLTHPFFRSISLLSMEKIGESLFDWSAGQHIQPIFHAWPFDADDPGTGSKLTIRTCTHTSGARGPAKDTPFRPIRGKSNAISHIRQRQYCQNYWSELLAWNFLFHKIENPLLEKI